MSAPKKRKIGPIEVPKEVLTKAATQARGIGIDGVVAAGKTGHLGLPLGCAELGAVMFGELLHFNPDVPRWLNRDRFILSAGHGSMFLYTWLHLSGYDIKVKDLAAFRHLHSITPGHPEYKETVGVEATTGPLGQGISNAVGFAVSGKMCQERFNTEEHKIFDNKVVVLCGDGCMQEGVCLEAVEFAGHQKLDNLIVFYDSNDVTLDAMADATQSLDAEARFKSIGWDVQEIDGHDMDAIAQAYSKAHAATGKPQLIICKTEIGRGIPEVAGTSKAHGEGGAKFAEKSKKALGLDPEHNFFQSDDVKAYFQAKKEARIVEYNEWCKTYNAWKAANPDNAKILQDAIDRKVPTEEALSAMIPETDASKPIATRAVGGVAINALAAYLPTVISGSADLHGSTKNYLKNAGGDFDAENRAGRNIKYGIREHAMGAIANGLVYDGIFQVSVATFFTFSDYMRASVRLSALCGLPTLWYWTHDSIGVGVDGPTHQPVETAPSLRCVPNLDLIKPGDAEEANGAMIAAFSRQDGPTGLSLSRQGMPVLSSIPVQTRRQGVLKGGYIAKKETDALTTILIACGSELHLAMEAGEELGAGTRVVSMPCPSRFDRQSKEYQEEVLPASCKKRVAIEAAHPMSWYKYVGLDGKVIGVERFGLSAPGDQVMKELGISKEALVAAAKSL